MLTSLDGRTFASLHGLHALQLAGPTNKWRCDCRLRPLAASVLAGGSRGRPSEAKLIGGGGEQRAANILQDEPQCFRPVAAAAADKNPIGRQDDAEGAKFWTNMSKFEA